MHAFEFKGFWGFVSFLVLLLLSLTLVLLVPSVLVTVAWNALVFESFKGVPIDLMQGALLWFATLLLLYALLQPEFVFELQAKEEPELPLPKAQPKALKKVEKRSSEESAKSSHWQQWRNRMDDEKK
jgi:hypothetical protein